MGSLTLQESLERLEAEAEAAEKAGNVTKNRQSQKKTAPPAVRSSDREILSCSTLPQEDNISDSDNEAFSESDEEWLPPTQSAREGYYLQP